MATYTPNLNLKKPSTGEYYDVVGDNNDAKDKIDLAVGQINSQINNSYINVKRPPAPFIGAKGDGVTDDGPAIQALINTNRPIFFPEGTFLSSIPLVLKKNNFRGISPKNTTLKFTQNGHGLVINSGTFPGRQAVSIGGFSLLSTALNRGDYYAVHCPGVAVNSANEYNFGINMNEIEIEGFGGGMYFSDIFRLNVSEIGMTGVINPITLVGSVVQSTFNAITNSGDNQPTSTLPNTGMRFLTKNYAVLGIMGSESVKSSNLSFALNNNGILFNFGLFCTFNNIDLDYIRDVGIKINYEALFENCYIASSNNTSKFIGILFESGDNSRPYKKIIKNAVINSYNVLHPDSVAIQYGDGNASPYREEWGGIIENCEITGSPLSWKHGILADRFKTLTVRDVLVRNNVCTGDEMTFTNVKHAIIEGNNVLNGIIRLESPLAEGFGCVKYNQATVTTANMTNIAKWDIGFNNPY